MKTLWTPWRMEHVLGKNKNTLACIFEPPGDTASDKSYLLLHRNKHTVVLLNRFPYANGHLLVAPLLHVPELSDLDTRQSTSLIQMVSRCTTILKKALKPDGINIGLNIGDTAGAGIADHLHFHIVPRWRGDHNFMTVCADIRTIPQHIDHTYDQLLPYFESLQLSSQHEE
jgi:ATP adenylyltransferase